MRVRTEVASRFWDKADQSGGPDACWPWAAATQRGYGAFRIYDTDGKRHQVNAHRVAYMLAHGDLEPGDHVLHACDNPPCVNPKHLSRGSRSENMRQVAEVWKRSGGRPVTATGLPRVILTAKEKSAIRDAVAAGRPIRAVARDFHVQPVTVRRYARMNLEGVSAGKERGRPILALRHGESNAPSGLPLGSSFDF